MDSLKGLCLMAAVFLAVSVTTATEISGNWSKHGNFIQTSEEHDCGKYTWLLWNKNSSKCECGPSFGGEIQCNHKSHMVWIKMSMCMTYDNSSGSTTAGECPFSVFTDSQLKHHFTRLPKHQDELNNAVCDKAHREGLLCSKCKPGYGPSVLSYGYPCAKCSGSFYGWLFYFSVAFLPAAAFFLIIVLCQIRITFPPLIFLVFVCQVFSAGKSVQPNRLHYPDRDSFTGILVGTALTAFTSFNLDFFHSIIPPFCISENLSNLQMLCMDYIVAFSPLLLTVVMYISIQQHAKGWRVFVLLWKPFAYCFKPLTRKFNWNPLESIVHIFSSFLVLSSTKFLFVSSNLLEQAHATTINDGAIVSNKLLLYYDPNLTLFGQHHLPYAVLSVLVCTSFVILPFLVLCLYPTRLFQKCLNLCGLRWHAVHAFADVFNGCYKDGSNGTRDCRYFAGFYFLLRFLWLADNHYYRHILLIQQTLAIVSVVMFALASPYKNRLYNILETCGLTLGTCRLCLVGRFSRDIFGFASGIFVAAYLIGFVCSKIIIKLNCPGARKLKAIADKFSVISVSRPTGRRIGVVVNSLPDRVENPEEYSLLSEVPEEQCDIQSDVKEVPTYGII